MESTHRNITLVSVSRVTSTCSERRLPTSSTRSHTNRRKFNPFEEALVLSVVLHPRSTRTFCPALPRHRPIHAGSVCGPHLSSLLRFSLRRRYHWDTQDLLWNFLVCRVQLPFSVLAGRRTKAHSEQDDLSVKPTPNPLRWNWPESSTTAATTILGRSDAIVRMHGLAQSTIVLSTRMGMLDYAILAVRASDFFRLAFTGHKRRVP